MLNNNPKSFEEALPIITRLIERKRLSWTLDAVSYMDYDDVSQQLLAHFWVKFPLYNQERPFSSWCSTVISNRTKNILRAAYTSFSRPCLRCQASEGQGEDGCKIYESQCAKCPMYNHWEKTKKIGLALKLTLPEELHATSIENQESNDFDIEKATNSLHIKMQSVLKPVEWQIYEMSYIYHKSDEFICKKLSLKYNKESKTCYNKQLKNIKNNILTKAKEVLRNGEVDV